MIVRENIIKRVSINKKGEVTCITKYQRVYLLTQSGLKILQSILKSIRVYLLTQKKIKTYPLILKSIKIFPTIQKKIEREAKNKCWHFAQI